MQKMVFSKLQYQHGFQQESTAWFPTAIHNMVSNNNAQGISKN